MEDYPKTVYAAGLPYWLIFRGGPDLLKDERAEVARLVKEGGAVKGAIGQIEGRIANAYLWIIARQGKDIVGVAALKAPQQSYRDKLQRETGIELSEEKYPAELGYVAVSEA